MLGSAVVGGVILALIEGVSVGISRMSGQMVLNEQCNIIFATFFYFNSVFKICF
jgi:hypothetical protein